jgi:hypothetical protein
MRLKKNEIRIEKINITKENKKTIMKEKKRYCEREREVMRRLKLKKHADSGKKMRLKKLLKKGATGFEPVTSRSAVECSTTELYPH